MHEKLIFLEGLRQCIKDNRVFNGPVGLSLGSFPRTAHSLRSLSRGTDEILEYVFPLICMSLSLSLFSFLRSGPKGDDLL